MTAPTKDQLDRYMDLVVGGEEPEDAIAVIWADEPEPPKPAAPKKPTVMVSEFPDGVVIGWDFCTANNGGCGKTVAKCECKDGRPKEPRVFAKWREDSATMPDYSKAAREAKAAGIPATDSLGEGSTGVVVATQPKPVTPANSVPCREGKHFASIDEADKNDDGTYTCFACQEAGVQVDRG